VDNKARNGEAIVAEIGFSDDPYVESIVWSGREIRRVIRSSHWITVGEVRGRRVKCVRPVRKDAIALFQQLTNA
jgi:hypothetical protein